MSVSRFLACGMRRNKAALSSGCNMSPTRQPPQPEAPERYEGYCGARRSVYDPELRDIDRRACKIAKHREACDPAHVPNKLDLLDAQGDDASG